ncbi:MAG: polysaccharide deacetylase family protein [Ferruginibacter sp.]
MEPGSGSYFTSNSFFKTSLLTISFTGIYHYKSEMMQDRFFNPTVVTADSITVVEKKPAVKTKKVKTIYLTFDDGPNRGTQHVADIAIAEQVPVTFFIIGEHVRNSRQQYNMFDSLKNNGLFEIANHSYTHCRGCGYANFYSRPDSVIKDFEKAAISLSISSGIIRTPGRNIWRLQNIKCTDIKNSTAAADSLQNIGFTALGWDLEWHFTKQQTCQQTPAQMLDEVDSAFAKNQTKTPGHLVLLAHDNMYRSSADSTALHNFIISLKQKDEYNFETVSKYPGIKKD